jgi:hypothetical protein
MSKAEEKKNRRGKVVFCCIGFYFITASHKDKSITWLEFSLERERITLYSYVVGMREKKR